MRMGPFITLLSETYGLHEPSVAAVARVMREAGWLTSGARGVNAPDMTAADAARMTLALLSGQPPGRVVEEFEFLRALGAHPPPPDLGFTAGSGLHQSHCLEDGLIWLFGLTSAAPNVLKHGQIVLDTVLWPYVTVGVDASARAAQIHYSGHGCNYEDLARDQELDELRNLPLDLERLEQETAIENRSATWDSTRVALGRRMRAIRSITNEAISTISDAIAATRPASDTQD